MSRDLITTIVLAAGASARFGIERAPKPFLRFQIMHTPFSLVEPERAMWENCLFGMQTPRRLHLAMRRDHLVHLQTPSRGFESTHVIKLDETRGQADTLRLALQELRGFSRVFDELLVVNCDQGFTFGDLDRLVKEGRDADRVAVLTHEVAWDVGHQTRYSFVHDHPLFMYAQEKQLPTKGEATAHAMVGAYYFPRQDELWGALQLMHEDDQVTRASWDEPPPSEPYISQILGLIPGLKRSVSVARWHDWGIPSALTRYVEGPDEDVREP